MKIAITGSNGFLAHHLCVFLSQQGFEVIGCGRGENRVQSPVTFAYYSVELTDVSSIQYFFDKVRPDIIIHIAAMSKPDACMQNPDMCLLHNVTATSLLAEAAKLYNTKFIYSSTDFIFGEGGPHSEADTPAPLNFYGESKWMAEQALLSILPDAVIFRPVFIYGKQWPGMRGSFIHWVASALQANKPIKVVTDQLRTPTFAPDICQGITTIIRTNQSGIFHLAGKDILSPYEMATAVATILQFNIKLIEPVTADSFPEPVKRAKKSGLQIDKAKALLSYEPISFAEGVRMSFI
ncbi:MAG: SDR family oxidoreductase [Chitinophagaceae bacterium]|nr:SDR family oxidoreductase [Chitinophagaceae bacterium]